MVVLRARVALAGPAARLDRHDQHVEAADEVAVHGRALFGVCHALGEGLDRVEEGLEGAGVEEIGAEVVLAAREPAARVADGAEVGSHVHGRHGDDDVLGVDGGAICRCVEVPEVADGAEHDRELVLSREERAQVLLRGEREERESLHDIRLVHAIDHKVVRAVSELHGVAQEAVRHAEYDAALIGREARVNVVEAEAREGPLGVVDVRPPCCARPWRAQDARAFVGERRPKERAGRNVRLELGADAGRQRVLRVAQIVVVVSPGEPVGPGQGLRPRRGRAREAARVEGHGLLPAGAAHARPVGDLAVRLVHLGAVRIALQELAVHAVVLADRGHLMLTQVLVRLLRSSAEARAERGHDH